MLKKRITACLVIKNGIVVQSIGFTKYLPIGRPSIAVEFLSKWGIDEIVLLDIDATLQRRKPNLEVIREVSKKCFIPLTVGGGINEPEDIKRLTHCGADKICINKVALETPKIISESADVLGRQCIVVSIDVKKKREGKYDVVADSGTMSMDMDPVKWAKQVETLGAGEILLNSVDKDGCGKGYDLDLIRMVAEAVSIPVIACGGVGHPRHFLEGAVNAGASAVAAANFFHFTEHSLITTKSFLRIQDMDVRLDTYADYKDIAFQETGRISKRYDQYLDRLRFEHHPEEVI
ncbi:MAG: imidazole glycerol phosphate synthase subunit HisF [Candidatus Omnitrophica bacterium]|nr:imidazole glycerol phosphate synthase subunit HisF [Candidatus Omnitrophota bacterium]